MTLTTLIGMTGCVITLTMSICGGFLLGNDILHPPFLYKVFFSSWIAGLICFHWANNLVNTHARISRERMLREIDSVVVDAPELTEKELKRIMRGSGKKGGKKIEKDELEHLEEITQSHDTPVSD